MIRLKNPPPTLNELIIGLPMMPSPSATPDTAIAPTSSAVPVWTTLSAFSRSHSSAMVIASRMFTFQAMSASVNGPRVNTGPTSSLRTSSIR